MATDLKNEYSQKVSAPASAWERIVFIFVLVLILVVGNGKLPPNLIRPGLMALAIIGGASFLLIFWFIYCELTSGISRMASRFGGSLDDRTIARRADNPRGYWSNIAINTLGAFLALLMCIASLHAL